MIAPLQGYLRESARQRYETVKLPPFTLFFHPTDPFPHFSYAIPDEPIAGDVQEPLVALRREFTARGRQPRFEFVEEYTPNLALALKNAGFIEEARAEFMLCTPQTFQPVPAVSGLMITTIHDDAPLADVRDYLTVQSQGFNPDITTPAATEEAESFRATLRIGTAFLARLAGEAVSVGMLTHAIGGVTEWAGVATRAPYRRRGIASALTAHAAQTAFNDGIEVVCLSAGDRAAGRVYERAGFRPYATMLAYHIASAESTG